jgi:deoxyribodipyrimidine photo-lyase
LIKNILSLNSKRKVLEYLDDFSKKKLLLYGKMRNFDLEDKSKNNVSYLSPLVARGIITEQEIVKRVLKRHKFKDIEKFIYEVYWRSYWRGFLESHPKIYSDYKIDLKNLVEHTNLENYASAINGKNRN